jgi:PhzF family phenazine biosynthesis protein
MNLKLYQVDAFTNSVFGGNPAAVCPLVNWISNDLMQRIAEENNLAETAYYVKKENKYELRWFTPTMEVDLCGHATLATAFVLFNHEGFQGDTIHFYSPRSGSLRVKKQGDRLTLNFPTDIYKSIPLTDQIIDAFNIRPINAFMGKTDYMIEFESESDIKNLTPDWRKIEALGERGVIVTASGDKVDFVSRFFAPQTGIDEDPVTGSAHTTLTPFWAKKLGKSKLSALQLSSRQGDLECNYLGDRVEISGQARLYMIGEIYV